MDKCFSSRFNRRELLWHSIANEKQWSSNTFVCLVRRHLRLDPVLYQRRIRIATHTVLQAITAVRWKDLMRILHRMERINQL